MVAPQRVPLTLARAGLASAGECLPHPGDRDAPERLEDLWGQAERAAERAAELKAAVCYTARQLAPARFAAWCRTHGVTRRAAEQQAGAWSSAYPGQAQLIAQPHLTPAGHPHRHRQTERMATNAKPVVKLPLSYHRLTLAVPDEAVRLALLQQAEQDGLGLGAFRKLVHASIPVPAPAVYAIDLSAYAEPKAAKDAALRRGGAPSVAPEALAPAEGKPPASAVRQLIPPTAIGSTPLGHGGLAKRGVPLPPSSLPWPLSAHELHTPPRLRRVLRELTPAGRHNHAAGAAPPA